MPPGDPCCPYCGGTYGVQPVIAPEPQPPATTPNRRQMVASYRQRRQEGNIANYAEGYLDGVRSVQQQPGT